MANVFATKSGNWSDTTVWNTLALPATVDDVFANNFTVTININAQVLSIRTTAAAPAVAGGAFNINSNISLSANIVTGSTNCLTFASVAPNSCTLVGNVSGSLTTAERYGFVNNSTGTINVFGNVKGGSASGARGILNNSSGIVNIVGNVEAFSGVTSYGVLNNSTGTVNVTGTVIAGPIGAGTEPHGMHNQSTGTINVLGQVLGGSSSNGTGIRNASTGVVNVTGSVTGGSGFQASGLRADSSGFFTVFGDVAGGSGGLGISNAGNNQTIIYGNVTGGSGTNAHGIINTTSYIVLIYGNVRGGAGSTAYGAFNNATGYMEVQGLAVGNGWGLGSSGIGGAAPGVLGSQTGTTIIRGLSCGARGQWPTAGNVFIIPQNTSTASFETSAFQDVTLITSLSDGVVPPVSSVRLGTIYNLGDYRGTCAMPSVSSVLQGVAVDNSVGIAALQPQTIWNYSVLSATDVDSLGGRLKEVATVQSVGQQLTAVN